MPKLIYPLLFASSFALAEAEPTPEGIQFFEEKIRPVLIDSCYECHSREAGESKGGLILDSRVGLRQGGNTGPGVVPHNLEESWLWLSVSRTEPDYEMPPKVSLPPEIIADFKTWIEMGAPDPREGERAVVTDIDVDAGREFWSFQRPVRPTPPTVISTEWSQSPVDQFIYAKLQEEELTPAPPASAYAILRRLCYDLIGMPPTLDFTYQFHRAWREDPTKALESTVDQLMNSPQFGERWGRHWLDVARYAETNGHGSNQTYPHAWRYRDYVIDAINKDKPWNEFILEQMAGDLIPADTDEEWQEHLIATGFLALGPKNLRERDGRQMIMDMVDEQINTTSLAFLGLTVSCARCHDHKTDPIPTADYYAMAGIFLSSNTHYGTDGVGGRYNQGNLIILPLRSETNATFSDADIAELHEELALVNEGLADHTEEKRAKMEASREGSLEVMERSSAKRLREKKGNIEAQLASISQGGYEKAFAMGMTDKEEPVDTNILVRGEVDSPAQVVDRGFLQVLNHDAAEIQSGSGRLELAHWIASDQNPLTARVLVNRTWEKLFGQGLVPSVDNFGTTGQAPTHPELLDHLAIHFMENGWSLKDLVKTLVLTRTYRSGSDFNEAHYQQDPDNNYLWRATPKRLDAESFRDAILAASGQLRFDRPFRSPIADYPIEEMGRRGSPNVYVGFPSYRSVYLPPIRDAMPELIDLFDGADPAAVTGRRISSNGAEQSLYLLNSPFIEEQAEHFADSIAEKTSDIDEQIEMAFVRAFGRKPSRAEYHSSITFRDSLRGSDSAESNYLELLCQGLIVSAEFRYLN